MRRRADRSGVRSIETMEDPVAQPRAGTGPAGRAQQAPRLAGIPLGRVAGFPLSLTASWVVLAVVVTIAWGTMIGVRHLQPSLTVAYLVGLAMVAGLLVSVLLHELGHALHARVRHGRARHHPADARRVHGAGGRGAEARGSRRWSPSSALPCPWR